jgi:hypothetical protein
MKNFYTILSIFSAITVYALLTFCAPGCSSELRHRR